MAANGNGSLTAEFSAQRAADNRGELRSLREQAQRRFEGGATGVQVAAAISEATDALIVKLFVHSLAEVDEDEQQAVRENSAVIAVGGSGRGELAPYSDTDLLFLYSGPTGRIFTNCASQAVRDCWDAGLELGHSIRTQGESIRMARQEPQVATGLIEARLLWGNEHLFDRFRHKVRRRIIDRRLQAFLDDCITAREEERNQNGSTVHQLQPDIKRSPGGLRDVHLIRWVGFARHKAADVDTLRLKDALSKDDARMLVAANEFLMRIRIDLHFAAGKSQDILSREEQLRIAEKRNIEATPGQRPVERFMQNYFRHSTAIAEITDRFVAVHQRRSIKSLFVDFLTTHRAENHFKVGQDHIDLVTEHRSNVLGHFNGILDLYRTAAMNGVSLVPRLIEDVKQAVGSVQGHLTDESAAMFVDLLRYRGRLGQALRSMYTAGLLELIIPDMAHARCLLQFNHYHSYTVDEHTLRAIEAAEQLEQDDGPLGTAYRAIHRKEILHLALLLHDLGKGFEQDHSDVGKDIAERIATRLQLTPEDGDTLVFLVHKHLNMAHTAFRRDISDPQTLMEFSHEVGSPETLRMLYVLTAADIMAVGPNRWTSWKAELLTELFDRIMLILSGKHLRFHEEERLARIKSHVQSSIVPLDDETSTPDFHRWIHEQLDLFPPHYLMATTPDRIAADLSILQTRQLNDLYIEGNRESDTGTFEYRIVTHENAVSGCFHKMTGALAARRLEIFSAQISTSVDGTVIDSFRVVDRDNSGQGPQTRIEEISEVIRRTLTGESAVEQLFQRHRRYDIRQPAEPISNLPMRVAIDNVSSDRCTIIDVFAHDRTGLLYTIARTLNELELSVVLAKISTHLDQVVDVFYITDANNQKIAEPDRLRAIQTKLTSTIEEFEQLGHKQFL